MKNYWNIKNGKRIQLGECLLAGIINATPDSFYDGGKLDTPESAIERGLQMAKEGASILDVGGESTRPGARAVDEAEELDRVVPIVRGLAERLDADENRDYGDACVSIDTYKAKVATQALLAGASIVNDVSACAYDFALRDVLCEYKPGYVLMHSLGRPENMQDSPEYTDVVAEIKTFFESKLRELTQAGLPEDNIVLDPGIGFGKLTRHNIRIMREIETFFEFGRPIYIGLSNKSVWGKLLNLDVHERGSATAVASALMALKGVSIHRVHDVRGVGQAMKIMRELYPTGIRCSA